VRREYRGNARRARLVNVLGSSTADLTITCDNLDNWPTGAGNRPFYIVISRNTATEEKILCVSRSGNTMSVFNTGLATGRGADETPIVAHSVGEEVEHIFTATDANEANAHVNAPANHITVVTSTTRPAVPAANQTILETDTGNLLAFINGVWTEVSGAGATGGGTNRVFFENDKTITANYTITANKNAGTFGPVTINSGVTVTVPAGSVWSVV
jgi:hypothetical protein